MTNEDERLIKLTNRTISDLVFDKIELQKAYNIYNGKRDAEQYKYLEDNFGIGTPTSVEFTPLVRKHVDAMVGEFLGTPILPKITCKDKETITNIQREKQLKIDAQFKEFLSHHLQNNILKFITGQAMDDASIKRQLDQLMEDIEEDFISEYEVAAQNIIQYILQSRRTDLLTKLKTILLDLFITGYTFYRAKPSSGKTNVEIEVLDPRNTFIDRNPESPYVKDSYRAVVRKWMTRPEILARYGKELSDEDVARLKEEFEELDQGGSFYMRGLEGIPSPMSEGIQARFEGTFGLDAKSNANYRLIPVYEVEWIETDKDFIMQRYETIRIGDNQSEDSFFILRGKNENVVRSKDDPAYCTLSINGLYFLNRSDEPYSLVLACAHLQDKYDILHFFRDNLIANSGTVGDWIDTSLIPTYLGPEPAERLLKWISYKKAGVGLIDTAQEGRIASGQAPLNQTFNGFDDTIKVQAIQGIQLAIQDVEDNCSSITGVFRERLQGIEQRDAVSNIKQGVQNSFIVTKQWFHQMDTITAELLIDSLNVAKVVYKKGITGTIILGDKRQKIFTALPEHFTVTDYDISVVTTSDLVQDLEQIKAVLPDFIKGGQLPADILFEIVTCKSPTDVKIKIRRALKKQKEENNMIQQLQQQLQEAQQQLQQLQNENSQLKSKVESLNEARMQLDARKIEYDKQVNMYKAQTDRDYKTIEAQVDQDKVLIEKAQLYDDNPYNDKIRMS